MSHVPEHVPLQSPSHRPAQLPFASLTAHVPEHEPLHVALHLLLQATVAPAFAVHEPEHCALHVPASCPGSHLASSCAGVHMAVASHFALQVAVAPRLTSQLPPSTSKPIVTFALALRTVSMPRFASAQAASKRLAPSSVSHLLASALVAVAIPTHASVTSLTIAVESVTSAPEAPMNDLTRVSMSRFAPHCASAVKSLSHPSMTSATSLHPPTDARPSRPKMDVVAARARSRAF